MQAPRLADVDDPDIVVVGFPYEGVRVWARDLVVPPTAARKDPDIYARAGAHLAPDEIRRHSIHLSLEHSPGGYFPEWGREYRIADGVSLCDGGDLPADETGDSEQVLKGAADVLSEMIGPARIPILLGGDDTVPYVGVSAVAGQRQAKIGVIKLDSHFDLALEPPFWAGSQWVPLMQEDYLEPHNLALIGIRGLRNRTLLHEVATELGVPYWTMADVDDRGITEVIREALAALDPDIEYLYLSLDLDVIDPAFLPAQKYPEPGGLTARETIRAIRTVIKEGPEICGFDMACLGPQYDVNGLGSHLAARCAAEVIEGVGYMRTKTSAAN